MKRSFFMVGLSLLIGVGLMSATALAQPYPNRNVQWVIPATPGSILDIAGRLLGDEVGKLLNTQFIALNKPGGAFTVGTDFVAKSKKDGYTLCYTNNPAIVYGRVVSPDAVGYDPDKDLEPLGIHLFFAHAIAVREDSPFKSFKDVLEYAKKNPGKLNVNTPGIGSTTHFHLEIIQSLTGVQFNHVPFKSGEAVITGLLGGHVDMTCDAVSKLKPHSDSGKVRMLLITVKSADFPNLPTIRDLGYDQDLTPTWFGMYGPAGMPPEVTKTLVPAFEKAVKNPELKEKIEKLEFIVDYRSPAEQVKLAQEEYKTALEIAKRIGLGKK